MEQLLPIDLHVGDQVLKKIDGHMVSICVEPMDIIACQAGGIYMPLLITSSTLRNLELVGKLKVRYNDIEGEYFFQINLLPIKKVESIHEVQQLFRCLSNHRLMYNEQTKG